MANAPVPPLVPVEEYLNTSYEPDMEYVDGVLVEKGMPTIAHNLLGRLLLFWFAQYEAPLRFTVMYDVARRLSSAPATGFPTSCFARSPFPRAASWISSRGW